MIKIDYYFTIDNKCPYLEWFDRLDNSIKVRIEKRLNKLKQGNYGDYKPLQKSELSEIRMDFGKGYRIYYYQLENILILFVAGSDKKDQKKVIQQANNYFTEYCERTHYDPNSRTN